MNTSEQKMTPASYAANPSSLEEVLACARDNASKFAIALENNVRDIAKDKEIVPGNAVPFWVNLLPYFVYQPRFTEFRSYEVQQDEYLEMLSQNGILPAGIDKKRAEGANLFRFNRLCSSVVCFNVMVCFISAFDEEMNARKATATDCRHLQNFCKDWLRGHKEIDNAGWTIFVFASNAGWKENIDMGIDHVLCHPVKKDDDALPLLNGGWKVSFSHELKKESVVYREFIYRFYPVSIESLCEGIKQHICYSSEKTLSLRRVSEEMFDVRESDFVGKCFDKIQEDSNYLFYNKIVDGIKMILKGDSEGKKSRIVQFCDSSGLRVRKIFRTILLAVCTLGLLFLKHCIVSKIHQMSLVILVNYGANCMEGALERRIKK